MKNQKNQKDQKISRSIWKVPKMFCHLERPKTGAAHSKVAPEPTHQFWKLFLIYNYNFIIKFYCFDPLNSMQ